MPTKKVILIVFARRPPSLKTVCPTTSGFSHFFPRKTAFFEKIIIKKKTQVQYNYVDLRI